MPTVRPRFQVTETPAIERALRIAAKEWPDASRSELVVKLFEEGARAVEAAQGGRRADRLAAIEQTAGVLSGLYETGYLDELRKDWPD